MIRLPPRSTHVPYTTLYRSHDLARRLAQADPRDARAQRDLSVSYNKLGDVTLQFRQAKEAICFYQMDLDVSQRLAQADPRDAQAQRDLSVSYNKLGDVTLQL